MPARRDQLISPIVFICALLGHFYLVTRNWTTPFMLGHEFRQAQTALISYYIDQQDNFSLLYEQPLFGKPWISLLLEVPVYEWSVVGLGRLTGWPHYVAARTVSLVCFYLTLPAIWWLLGRFWADRSRQWLSLALIVACPIHIFYTRAFLMESMELMCCAWFLFGFVRWLDLRRWPWFVLATVAGTGAALIKSSTLAVWLLPAMAYGGWVLWQDLRARTGWLAPVLTTVGGLAAVTVPLGALYLWIDLTDPIKANHTSAWIFTSKNLSQGNWGLTNLAARFSPATWKVLAERWSEGIMPPWLLVGGFIIAVAASPQQRWRVLGLGSVFFLAQFMFPFAYAYQDYYFYACAVFLLAALGYGLSSLLDTRHGPWVGWLALAVPFFAQLNTYARGYYTQQIVRSNGGFSYTEALRELVPRESVIVVAGADWAAMIPFYSQRKALMIRNGLTSDQDYLRRVFAELADEDVAALILNGDQRKNHLVRDLAVKSFGLDAVPTFAHPYTDIYCSQRYSNSVKESLTNRRRYADLTVAAPGKSRPAQREIFRVSSGLARTFFTNISPAPLRAGFTYGQNHMTIDGELVLSAHPDTDLWLHPPATATSIEWDYGMVSSAWEREGDKTDGIDLRVTGLLPGGVTRVIYERALRPTEQPADRGRQRIIIPYVPLPGELLHFHAGPGKSYGFDWTYWVRVEVK